MATAFQKRTLGVPFVDLTRHICVQAADLFHLPADRRRCFLYCAVAKIPSFLSSVDRRSLRSHHPWRSIERRGPDAWSGSSYAGCLSDSAPGVTKSRTDVPYNLGPRKLKPLRYHVASTSNIIARPYNILS
ncbi:hypothetical protein QR680_018568 [Steinernema hermaphroditum]|uniref:Uncharacterized protein n=1 Tax=Steinernema hermaphroditum TaxID=289476 RepID=A0AA39HID4_9BILA|nr:hypothetical protein QR680_018568 [Steinernema hermaphroditum]